jgi:hypothetical protein
MKYLLSFLFLFTLLSCSQQAPDFFTPSELFIESDVRFSEIDTITFKMSTFKFDSIVTDIGNIFLVGQYNDPHFGKIKSSGFIDVIPRDYEIDDEAIFDSIVLNLPYNGYYYNDTLLQKKIKVNELSRLIKFKNGQSDFYNTTNFPIATLLGERTFYPRIAKDSIKITLSNAFGSNLFYKIKDGIIDNREELKLHFKGLRIAPDDSENASIIGFNVSGSYLRFYYSLPDEPDQSKYYDFVYNSSESVNKYFTQTSSDRTGTVFPNFLNQETEFFPSSTNPFTYINSGVGIVTKIDFPYFKESINNLNQSGVIYNAKLKIPMNEDFFSKKLYPSDSLQVYIVDQNNAIYSRLQEANGKAVIGYVKNDTSGYNETYVSISIGSFLENKLKNNAYKNYSLIIVPFNFSSSTTRLILNSQNNSQAKSKLILTYLNYGN